MTLFNNNYFLKLFPFLISFFFFLIMVLPIMPRGMGEITPMFGVIVLSYWLIYKDELLPFYSVFMLGLFFDVLLGTVFGVGSLAAIVIKIIIARLAKQRHQMTFFYAFLIILLSLITWTLVISFPVIITNYKTLNYLPILFQLFCSIALVPLFIMTMNFFLRKMSKY